MSILHTHTHYPSMDAFLALFLLSFISHLNFFTAQIPTFSIVLPVTKDVSTLQYTTQIFMGSSPNLPTKLVLDLGGSSLWAHCTSKSYIQMGSLPCSMAKAGDSGTSSSGVKVNPNGVCEIYPENTITGMVNSGYLAEEIMTFDYLDKLKVDSITTVEHFLFSCSSSLLLKGLASGAKGMLGLGRSKIALTSQLANSFGLHRIFAVCLSSTDGIIFSGGGPYDVSKSLAYTPLVSSQGDSYSDYYINVKSIKVNGKKLSLGQNFIGKAKLSTIVPYTTLEKTLYNIFTKAFIMAAASMNMSRVESVAPFGLCFSSNGVEETRLGPALPSIDLVLQSELVKWRINARNSMVHVNDEVMCLGFFDGGLTPKNLIVIGGYQLEENLLQFNLGTSMLGFRSVLMEHNGCSGLRSGSISKGAL